LKFISSAYTVQKIGTKNMEEILTFLRKVFTLEFYYTHYYYKNERCFMDYSNTPLEGTNSGLKYGDFAVKRNMKLTKSCSNMINQDGKKSLKHKINPDHNLIKRRLSNLGAENGQLVSMKAWGELQEQVNASHKYISFKLSLDCWYILLSKEVKGTDNHGLFPSFDRIRCVSLNEMEILCCDCGHTVQYGIPCRHIAHVVMYHSKKEYHFTHENFDIRWWRTYSKFVGITSPKGMDTVVLTMRKNLMNLRAISEGRDLCSRFPTDLHNALTFALGEKVIPRHKNLSEQDVKTLFERPKSIVRNYSHEECILAIKKLGGCYAVGLSDLRYNGNNSCINSKDTSMSIDDDDDDDDDTDGNNNFINSVDNDEDYAARIANTETTMTIVTNEQEKSYEILTPMFKEILTMIQYAPISVFNKHKQAISDIVLQLKSDLNTCPPPKGKVISSATLNCKDIYGSSRKSNH
jgi:hypothetical protein